MTTNFSSYTDSPRLQRECSVVALLTLIAVWPRFHGFSRTGLVHFDEGIYALSGLRAVSTRGAFSLDPETAAYAPPVFPFLIGLSFSVLGSSDSAALLVSALVGVLTIPIVAWVARRTFGPGAGAAASAFAALSLAHVAFSRKALTDASFLIAWFGLMGMGARFLERPSWCRAVAFGLTVGLAQNIKYNGWLGLPVTVLAALFGLISDPNARRPRALVRTFGFGLVAVLVAAACYWPWYQFIERHGGYAELVRHHRSYLSGPQAWIPHWKSQLAQSVALSGSPIWGTLSWSTAWIGAGVAANGMSFTVSASRWDRARLRVGALFGVAILIAIPDVAWWVGLIWAGWLVVDPRPARRVLAAWWLVFSVMTPFYHPYARLWLPLHGAGWMLLAGVAMELGPFVQNTFAKPDRALMTRPKILLRFAIACVCLLAAWQHWGGERPRPLPDSFVFAPSDGFRAAAASISEISESLPYQGKGLHVLGRPPLAFDLALRGFGPIQMLQGREGILEGLPTRWVLLDSVMLAESLDESAAGRELHRRWRTVASWDLSLDAVNELDVDPGAAFGTHVFEKRTLVLLAPRVVTPPVSVLLPPPTLPRNKP